MIPLDEMSKEGEDKEEEGDDGNNSTEMERGQTVDSKKIDSLENSVVGEYVLFLSPLFSNFQETC